MNAPSSPGDSGFLSRWSRRKLQAGTDSVPAAEPVAPAPDMAVEPAAVSEPVPAPADDQPPPTLDELQALDHTADLTRFIAKGVDEGVRSAALRKLFADPQFNVMDGLDTYIDDYNTPSPVPPGLLARLRLTPNLGLDLADTALAAPAAQRPADARPDSTSEDRAPTIVSEADATDQSDSAPTPDMPQDASMNATPPTP
ncbi:MAG: DUF3306 domain-containing protein [Thiomonas sp.]|nr:DUF3306 domain-containing protein [Thiomonas sp.]